VDADPAKAGFGPGDLRQLDAILALPNLDVRGLMTVGWPYSPGPGGEAHVRTPRELDVVSGP
jgi:uncharacterized pyridoxal phosphate-containing UPF0001 family protein